MKLHLVGAMVAMSCPVSVCLAQAPGGVDLRALATESQPAAQRALAIFGQLVTTENALEMGFSSPGDVARSELGTPLADFMIGLDAIRAYQPGQDPLPLLTSTGEVVYPVGVGGGVNASVVLKKNNSNWEPVSFGAPVRSQAVGSVRETAARSEGVSLAESFQVRIPAYNLFFVGTIKDGRLILTPAMDFAQFDLRAGTSLSAEEVLLRLKPVAERDEGLPR